MEENKEKEKEEKREERCRRGRGTDATVSEATGGHRANTLLLLLCFSYFTTLASQNLSFIVNLRYASR